MRDHLTQRFRPARLLAGAAALVTATTIAACGSSSPTGSSSPAATSSSTGSASPLAFSKCMRASGVPNFPDLSSNRMLIEATGQTISINGVSVNAPAFVTARQKCERYRPHTRASQAQAAQQTQRGLQFARCMRSHGVPNWPDPKIITGANGQQAAYLPGVNLQAPAVQGAAKACGGGPKGP